MLVEAVSARKTIAETTASEATKVSEERTRF